MVKDQNDQNIDEMVQNTAESIADVNETAASEAATTQDDVLNTRIAELENQLRKSLADYANLERSIDSRTEMRLAHLKRQVAADMLEIVDDLKLAEQAGAEIEMSEAVKAWLVGMLSTANKMHKVLNELGISIIEAKVGDPFDSDIHEAIGIVKEGAHNTIHAVVQPGYRMGEMIVRPARVIVSKNA